MRASSRSALAVLALLAGSLAIAGCAPAPAWQRGLLAHECMRPGARPEEQQARAHMLGARESSIGATGARGGGCGCR